MKEMSQLSPSTKLLTLINVAQARPTKRARSTGRDWYALAKKANRTEPSAAALDELNGAESAGFAAMEDPEDLDEGSEAKDSYERHWAGDTPLLEVPGAADGENLQWRRKTKDVAGLGKLSESRLDGGAADEVEENGNIYNHRLMSKLKTRMEGMPKGVVTNTQEAFLRLLASYRDVFYPKVSIAQHDELRSSIALHAMNHVLKTRSRVLKNNDHLAKLASTPTSTAPPRNTADQGFTRPKVLVLLPFRNSALAWVDLLTTLSQADTVENLDRFKSEFSLPEGAVDKLVENTANYPEDHVETFKGNIDDSFRLGMKVTRKTVKLFSEFYSCDVIVASPLGLRTSIEKEKDSDFLSSIEILIVDQMDVMMMQNWEHVQFVMDRLNKTPGEAHGCDFSRVKPWYLDGKSALLRQSILLSAYETPEMRALYSKTLTNVGGKVKAETYHEGVLTNVPSGIKQVFTRFETPDVWAEDDARFEHFTTKTLPTLLRSAVASSQTIIFVPSYFDFVRLKRYMKKLDDFSFTSISEYSSTPDVSRARGAFFSGKKSFLLTTERFHFFRRYRIRGCKTFIFYAPPSHAPYYPEVLSFPYPRQNDSKDEEPVDETELAVQVLFSKFDLLSLERICGTEDAKKMVAGSDVRFTFL